jgi:hypothetical protein
MLLVLFLLPSCNKKKSGLEIILLTNEIRCVEIPFKNVFEINEKKYFKNGIYDSLSKNIINYKIVNNSSEKYFIILNKEDIDVLESHYLNKMGIKYDGVFLNLYNNNSILSSQTTLTSGGSSYETELEYYKSSMYRINYIDSLFIVNANKMKLYKTKSPSVLHREILENSFVIYPGESKYFTSLVNLPLRKNKIGLLTDVNKIKPNLSSISIVNNASYTNEKLSKNQKKEIKENGYTIFDGVIQSNKVPVKMVRMPE